MLYVVWQTNQFELALQFCWILLGGVIQDFFFYNFQPFLKVSRMIILETEWRPEPESEEMSVGLSPSSTPQDEFHILGQQHR